MKINLRAVRWLRAVVQRLTAMNRCIEPLETVGNTQARFRHKVQRDSGVRWAHVCRTHPRSGGIPNRVDRPLSFRVASSGRYRWSQGVRNPALLTIGDFSLMSPQTGDVRLPQPTANNRADD